MRKKHLDLHQRVLNAAASQAVENVKAQHTYLHGRADASGEWGQIWSRDPWCSWGHIFGRMRGWDQVWKGSVTAYDNMAMQNSLNVQKIYPEIGGKDPRPLMEASVHTLFTDIIEVADDGATAKGFFYVFGLVTDITTRGPISNWVLGSICFDFIRENDQWKIWHALYLEDIDTPAGKKWGNLDAIQEFPEMPEFAAMKDVKLAEPNVPMNLRALYTGSRPFAKLPKVPEPYDTFEHTFSYGAESQEALR